MKVLLPASVAEACEILAHHPDAVPVAGGTDLFVLPSLFEGLPLVMLEAVASGCPCLVSRLPTIESWVPSQWLGSGFPQRLRAATDRAVLLYDRRGYGRSTPRVQPWSADCAQPMSPRL